MSKGARSPRVHASIHVVFDDVKLEQEPMAEVVLQVTAENDKTTLIVVDENNLMKEKHRRHKVRNTLQQLFDSIMTNFPL